MPRKEVKLTTITDLIRRLTDLYISDLGLPWPFLYFPATVETPDQNVKNGSRTVSYSQKHYNTRQLNKREVQACQSPTKAMTIDFRNV